MTHKISDWLEGHRVIAIETWTSVNPRSIFTDTYVKMVADDGRTMIVKWDRELAKRVEIDPLNDSLIRSKNDECNRHTDGGATQPSSS